MEPLKIFDLLPTERAYALLLHQAQRQEGLSPNSELTFRRSLEYLAVHNAVFLSHLLAETVRHPDWLAPLLPVLRSAYLLAPDERTQAHLRMMARVYGAESAVAVKPKSPPFTEAQHQSLRYLEAMANVYFEGETQGGLELRLNPLITGPSGTGKSFLVRELGERLGFPILRLTIGEWLVTGAAQQPTTFQVLQDFIQQHKRCIVHLDELDKFRHDGASNWGNSLLTEALGLLDRRIHCSGTKENPWTPEHAEHLRQNVFLVGSGAWHEIWNQQIAGTADRAALVRKIREARIIPSELLNRFNDGWILLRGYSADDFRTLGEQFGLTPTDFDPVKAVASGLNFRYLQNVASQLAIRKRLDA
jgi:hypothetical protein